MECCRIERMFEDVRDAGVVDEIGSSAREENAACAHRLAAIGELWARRRPDCQDERRQWAIDGFENVVAEVSAALAISRGRASGQLRHAIALREQLPRVAEVFASGAIDFRMMSALVARTELIDDPRLLAKVDAALARRAVRWTRLSAPKLVERIDWWVARFDPAGVRLPKKPTDDRYVDIAATQPGMAGVWGSVYAPDAAALDQRLDQLAASVCPNDPRTAIQRRADALGALATQQTRLACGCGSPDCPAATGETPVGAVVIHVLAEQATLAGSAAPGYLPGFGPLPAAQVRDLAASAKLRPLAQPRVTPEPGYRPSTALAEFVRARDLTCRFPCCDKPAAVCDIDHTVPFQLGGPTHASNLKLLCRAHHLLKTFYTGPTGWADRQLPDGTVVWTAPTGHAYTTTPEGSFFFPMLALPTGVLVIPPSTGAMDDHRGLMMPRRKRLRERDRQYRVAQERRINEVRIATERREREAWLAANYEPPPFWEPGHVCCAQSTKDVQAMSGFAVCRASMSTR